VAGVHWRVGLNGRCCDGRRRFAEGAELHGRVAPDAQQLAIALREITVDPTIGSSAARHTRALGCAKAPQSRDTKRERKGRTRPTACVRLRLATVYRMIFLWAVALARDPGRKQLKRGRPGLNELWKRVGQQVDRKVGPRFMGVADRLRRLFAPLRDRTDSDSLAGDYKEAREAHRCRFGAAPEEILRRAS